MTQRDMNICMAEEAAKAEKHLRQVIKNAEERLHDDTRAIDALAASNDAWETFRDAECRRLSDPFRGGTILPLIHASCLLTLTEHRAQVLGQERQHGALPREDVWRDQLESGTYWGVGDRLSVDATCDGINDTAIGGLRVGTNQGQPALSFTLVIIDGASDAGDPKSWNLELPIGGNAQNALCAPAVSLSAGARSGHCPSVRIDDGACDAFHVRVVPKSQTLAWERN